MSTSTQTTTIPAPVIVLLCILGAAALVIACVAVNNIYFSSHVDRADDPWRERSMEQNDYMKSVRARNRWWEYNYPPQDDIRMEEMAAPRSDAHHYVGRY